jgi:hypothetical protein
VVLIDGVALDPFYWRGVFALAPGVHHVEVSAPNRGRWSESVTVTMERVTTAQVRPSTNEPGSPPREAGSSYGPDHTVGLAVLGVGGAGIATSVIVGLMVINKSNERKNLCVGGCATTSDQAHAVQVDEAGRTLSLVSSVAFAAGAALALGGAYLVLSATKHPPKTAVTPIVTTRDAAIALTHTF